MIWADFLDKIKQFNLQVMREHGYTIIAGTVAGERRHTTEQVDDENGIIDNVDVTRILNRFQIDERLFRDHY